MILDGTDRGSTASGSSGAVARGFGLAEFARGTAGCTRYPMNRCKESLEIPSLCIPLPEDVRRCGRSSALRGFAAPGGPGRPFPVRDVRGMKCRRSLAPKAATKHGILQEFYGSDGRQPLVRHPVEIRD